MRIRYAPFRRDPSLRGERLYAPLEDSGRGETRSSVRDPLGDAHEHVFEVDLLLPEHLQLDAALHQRRGDEAAVEHALLERHLQVLVGVALADLFELVRLVALDLI